MESVKVTSFLDWTNSRHIEHVGSNAGTAQLAFQGWRPFKEAFAPELVRRAIQDSKIPVKHCLDPFGGSGTTALACQFLGIEPITFEVNPFLHDLITAKLTVYDPSQLCLELHQILELAAKNGPKVDDSIESLPATFIQPGVNKRWLFDKEVARRVFAIRASIAQLRNAKHRRLFRVLLGGILVPVSNAITSGKGRRYRSGWEERTLSAKDVDAFFISNCSKAIEEIAEFGHRPCTTFQSLRGDSRSLIFDTDRFDVAVFSPPYPNSFDYTDVYNIELWMLGYLESGAQNKKLRNATLCSHVQLYRDYPEAPRTSPALTKTLRTLNAIRHELWNPWLPEMVGGYFADMVTVLRGVQAKIAAKGTTWIVVGDSKYNGVTINTGIILCELAKAMGFVIREHENFRNMKESAQQGGRKRLAETLVVLDKP